MKEIWKDIQGYEGIYITIWQIIRCQRWEHII